MRLCSIIIVFALLAILLSSSGPAAIANVPGIAISAPPPPPATNVATAGSYQIIKLVITHRDTGYPPMHYVDSVMLYDGGELLKEWKYDKNTAKKEEIFTETYSNYLNNDLKLRAVAHCTLHGYQTADDYVTVFPEDLTWTDMIKINVDRAGLQLSGYADYRRVSDIAADLKQFVSGLQKAGMENIIAHQHELKKWVASIR
ncbi:hypothetical protein CUJ83_10945 [Methanocella sp. CWC-04]|uniref:Uncharacterized protein n=1 Tax=Methanooceanicella nereidis TaxID=2052831 RepID=A0AAP2RDC7_9EURY|nr:hypothetical protein [Methanocella sp. CWC-04]MCD1295516.1 hypothetical protein [Methanocella sp. CWC-04]